MDISVIVPVYNEEENLEPLLQEIRQTLDVMAKDCEVIVVDDGSTDRTFEVIKRFHASDPRFKAVSLRRNFGQTAALAAGIAYASGNVLVPMDGDGQNHPADIPLLLQKIEEGFDLVNGWRREREDPFWNRQLPSKIANGLISWMTKVKLHDYGCTLKAMRGDLAKNLKLYGEMHRFIPAIAYERGAKVVEIPVRHRARKLGKSKYGITRTVRVVLDLLTVKFLLSYATRPLHIFGLIGFFSGGLGFVIGMYLTAQKIFYGVDIGARPLLLLSILLIVIGVQFVTLDLSLPKLPGLVS